MALGGSIAGVAKAVLTADTSQFDRGMREAQSRFHHDVDVIEHDADRMGRGILAGSGAFSHLGRSIAFASGAFLGGAGFTAVVRSSIEAAEGLEKAHRALDAQIRAGGESVKEAQPGIEELDRSMARFGHTSTATEGALSRLVRATGDVADGEKLMGLAADLAAARHISLEQAALLVGKVFDGNIAALNRYGIRIEKGTSVTDALRIAQEKLAGQAQAGVTPMERLHATVGNLQATLGEDLLPTINHVATGLSNWLGNTRNQERVQRDFTQTLTIMGRVVRGLATGFKTVTDAVGGTKDTLKLLLEVGVGVKLAGWATAFAGLIGGPGRGTTAGTGLAGASSEAALLRTRLLGFNAITIAPIVVPIAIKVEGDEANFIEKHFGKGPAGLFGFVQWFATGGATGRNPVQAALGALGIGRGGTGPSVGAVGTLTQGRALQLPTTQTPTHQTENLPGFPAVDIMATPGTPLGAPEDGMITRITGHEPSEPPPLGQGGPWGLSIYYVGSNTGNTYYMTHLMKVARPGRYRKGDVIGVIGDYPGSPSDHVHFAIHQGRSGVAFAPSGSFRTSDFLSSGGGFGGGTGGGWQNNPDLPLKTKPPKPLTAAGGLELSPKLDAEQQENANLIFNTAKANGLNDQQALQMVAAAFAESKLRTNALNAKSGAFGLFQLLSPGYKKAYARYLAAGYDPATANLMAILPDYIKSFKAHKGAAPGVVASLVERSGEGPGFYSQGVGSLFQIGAGKPPARAAAPTDLIPAGLRLGLAEAQITKSNADDIRVLRKIDDYLRERLKHTTDINKRIEILNAISGNEGQIAALTPTPKTPPLLPVNLQEAINRAGTTRGGRDDLRALDNAIAFLERRIGQAGISEKSKAKLEKLLRQLVEQRNKIAAPIRIAGLTRSLPRLPSITGVTTAISNLQGGQGTRVVNVPGIGKILTAFSLTPTIGAWNKILGQLKKKYKATHLRLVALRRSLAKAEKARFRNEGIIAWLRSQIAGVQKVLGEIKADIATAIGEIAQLKKDAADKAQKDADEADTAAEAGAADIPVSIQQALADAEAAGDVPGQVAALTREAEFLQGELSSGTVVTAGGRVIDLTPEARVQVTTALTGVRGQITSLTTPPPTDTTAAATDTGTTDTGTTDIGAAAPVAVSDPLEMPIDLQQRFADANVSGDPMAMATPLAIEDNWLTGLINGGGLTPGQLVQATNMLADVRRQERELQPAAPEAAAPPDPNQIPVGFRLALAQAQGTPGTADDLVALRGERGFIQGRIAATTDPELLITLTDSLNGINSQIDDMIKNQETQIDQQAQFQEFFTGLRGLRGFESNILGSALGGSLIQVTNYFAQGPDDPHTFSAGVSFELRALVG